MKQKNFKHFLESDIDPSKLPLHEQIAYSLATDSKEIILWTLAIILTIVGIVAGFFFALPTSILALALTGATIIAGLSIVVALDSFAKPLRKEMENLGATILEKDTVLMEGFKNYQVKNPQTDLTEAQKSL